MDENTLADIIRTGIFLFSLIFGGMAAFHQHTELTIYFSALIIFCGLQREE